MGAGAFLRLSNSWVSGSGLCKGFRLKVIWEFPTFRVPYLGGVLIIRILLFRGLYY